MVPHRPSILCGVVVSAGKMMKAVKVRIAKQAYDTFLHKHFRTFKSHLVSDPSSSLRTGDIVRISPGWKTPTSRRIKHIVTEIVAPYASAIAERPPLASPAEVLAQRQAKRNAKIERRRKRREMAMGGSGRIKDVVEGNEDGQEDVVVAREREVPNERSRRIVGRLLKNEAVAETNMAEAERLQEMLDEKGLGVEDVRRLEETRL